MAFLIYSLLLLYAFVLESADSGYIITTPGKWTTGAGSKICASLDGGSFTSQDSINYKLEEVENKHLIQSGKLDLTTLQGQSFGCVDVEVPPSMDSTVTLSLTGTIDQETVNEMVNISFVVEGEKIFISTDKYLYQPGQTVQFRILSVRGPEISLVTDNYEEVFVTNPSNVRIAQWNDVDNSAGLVHLSFDLYEDVDNGMYTIGVKFPDKNTELKTFELQDYVLPRFEVTIQSPNTILGSDESVTVTLCAKYTFGEPVRGDATLYLATPTDPVYANLTQSKQINGCQNFTYVAKDLLFDYNNCHISINSLIADAVVVEEGTGVKIYGRNDYIQVHRTGILFQDRTISTVKKTYLPTLIDIATTYADGTPASNEPMEVCTMYLEEKVCKNFTTNGAGDLNFIIPGQLSSNSVEVKAVNFPKIERLYNDVMHPSEYFLFIDDFRKYVDSTNSSLTIMRKMLQCTSGENIEFKIPVVYVTTEDITAELNVQISSRGQVLASNKMEVELSESDLQIMDEDKLVPLETAPEGVILGSLDIPMILPEQSSPRISILVWYVKKDGSVVADATEVEISECLPHKVSFEWLMPPVIPGPREQTMIIIKGANNALCSIGVVDKSVEILSAGNNNYLNIQSLFDVIYNSVIYRSEISQQNLDYCLRKYGSSSLPDDSGKPTSNDSEIAPESDIILPSFSVVQALHMFNDAGYLVISNLNLARQFCEELIINEMKLNQEFERYFRIGGEADAATTPSSLFQDSLQGFLGNAVASPASEEVPSSRQERNNFPETWLWLLKPLSSSGELNEFVTFPDTITEWVGSAVCVHPTEGVGISNSSSVTTFIPFFVDLTLPSSAIRGEILPITISIFNYREDDLPVRVFVEGSTDFQFVEGETGVRELCIKSTFKAVEIIKVNLTRIGDINITVEASSQTLSSGYCGSESSFPINYRDRLRRSLPVESEGYLKELVLSEYICTQDIEDFTVPIGPVTVDVPESAVVDSERFWINVIGDLMGPTIENLGNLISRPFGCGEQNLINFAPSIYILQYLDASGQTTPSVRERIIGYLNEGYQRQLKFKLPDGSYSAFGASDGEGSTWLTAFVVKSFSQAKPYTIIDEEMLAQSMDWLENLQGSDGCFESKGRVVNKLIQGGISGSGGSQGLLTAYVLAALLESGNIEDEMRNSAIQCINTQSSTHPYSIALRSYSLALAKAPNAKEVIDQLLLVSVSNSSMLRWDLPDREGQSTSLHVETAAYALLSLVTFNYETYRDEARKIVRWISSQTNGQGGFVSTQDTVVALQALAAFEKTQPKEAMDMDILISTSHKNFTYKITDENRFLQQRSDILPLPIHVEAFVSGVGCALLQCVLRYNVLADSDDGVFSLKVNVQNIAEEGCEGKTRNITICTTYNLQDGASNMAIIAFKLTTGYVANHEDLQKIVGDGTGVFKRFEIDGQSVTFYLQEITSNEICVSVRAFPEIEIESAKPGSVSVYDYYQPEYIATKVLDILSPICTF